MQVRASVKVKTAGHQFEGQAGQVVAVDDKTPPEKCKVKFDLLEEQQTVDCADLELLATN